MPAVTRCLDSAQVAEFTNAWWLLAGGLYHRAVQSLTGPNWAAHWGNARGQLAWAGKFCFKALSAALAARDAGGDPHVPGELPVRLRELSVFLSPLDALRALEAAVRWDPNSPDVLVALGNFLRLASRHDEAAACYLTAVGAKPDHPLAMLGLYSIRVNRVGLVGAWQCSPDELRSAVAGTEYGRDYNRACVEAILGNPDGALAHLDAALSHDPFPFTDFHWAPRDPNLENLAADPRFAEVLSRVESGGWSDDFFFSYARADRGAVEPVADRLKERGLQVWTHHSEDYSDAFQAINEAIIGSRDFVLWVSAAYLRSAYCMREYSNCLAETSRPAGARRLFIMVLDDEGNQTTANKWKPPAAAQTFRELRGVTAVAADQCERVVEWLIAHSRRT